MLADALRLSGGHVVALVDTDPNARSVVAGVPLFSDMEQLSSWVALQPQRNTLCASVAVGGSRGKVRLDLARQLAELGLSLKPIIHPSAAVASSAIIGEGSHILANAVVAADTVLGACCIVNNAANVDHECVIGDGVHVAPGAILCGCIVVEACAMVGAGATILPRLTIGENAVIGAGAVVTKNVAKGLTVAGNPANSLRKK